MPVWRYQSHFMPRLADGSTAGVAGAASSGGSMQANGVYAGGGSVAQTQNGLGPEPPNNNWSKISTARIEYIGGIVTAATLGTPATSASPTTAQPSAASTLAYKPHGGRYDQAEQQVKQIYKKTAQQQQQQPPMPPLPPGGSSAATQQPPRQAPAGAGRPQQQQQTAVAPLPDDPANGWLLPDVDSNFIDTGQLVLKNYSAANASQPAAAAASMPMPMTTTSSTTAAAAATTAKTAPTTTTVAATASDSVAAKGPAVQQQQQHLVDDVEKNLLNASE